MGSPRSLSIILEFKDKAKLDKKRIKLNFPLDIILNPNDC